MPTMRLRLADAKAKYIGEILDVNVLADPFRPNEGGEMYHYQEAEVTDDQIQSLNDREHFWKWNGSAIVSQDDINLHAPADHPIFEG